jgi:hypothetical protein
MRNRNRRCGPLARNGGDLVRISARFRAADPGQADEVLSNFPEMNFHFALFFFP